MWALNQLQRKHLGPIENLAVASAAGIVNVFLTLPIWLINTRMKLQSKDDQKYVSNLDALIQIYQNEGLEGLFQGLVPSLILVSNPAIQFVGYEQMSKIVHHIRKRRGVSLDLGWMEHFLLGAIAKALATIVTYPYQVVKSRLQAEQTAKLYNGTIDATLKIFKTEGISSFYLGMESKMYQTVLNSAFMFVVYEKLVGFYLTFLSKTLGTFPQKNRTLLMFFLLFLLWRSIRRKKNNDGPS